MALTDPLPPDASTQVPLLDGVLEQQRGGDANDAGKAGDANETRETGAIAL